jgi:hypothetical protein
MPDITLTGSRPKAETKNVLNVNLGSVAPVHNDTTDQTVEYVTMEGVAPSPASISITENIDTTNASAVITITGATFKFGSTNGDYDVRVGDSVAGTGIGVGAKVASIDSPTQLTLDVVSTATGTINDLVITPPTYDAKLFSIVKNYTQSEGTLTVRVRVFLSDGTKNIDSNGDGADESVYTDYGNAILDRSFSVSTDTFLSNQRSARSV